MRNSRIDLLVRLALCLALVALAVPQSDAGDRAKRLEDSVPHEGVEFQVPTVKGGPCAVDVLAEDFDAGIPASWTVVNNEPGSPIFWQTNADYGRANFTACGANTLAAHVDSDAPGSGFEFDAELWTPVIDLTGFTNVSINAEINYQNLAGSDFLDIDVSTDGGGSWANVLSWNEDHPVGGLFVPPGEVINLDVTAQLAGQANAVVRFHYYDPNTSDFDWYAQVDCFSIRACPSEGACCSNGPGIETECFVTDQADCETNHKIFLGAGTECTADVDCDALTATMEWMNAKATDQGVEITWQTAVEINTAGFRVLRETLSGREKSRAVVAEMIPSMSNGIDGASYMVLDAAPEAASATAYIIQELDVFGKVTDFPPIQIDRGIRQQPEQRRAAR